MKITPLHPWIAQKIGCEGGFDLNSLERYHLERLNWVIQFSKQHSRFYRERLAGFAERISTLAEFSTLPFTTADDLRADPNRFACVPQDEIQRIVTLPTSGTTGDSKRIFFSASDQELTVDFFKVGMSTLAQAGDRVLILLPSQRPGTVGDLLKIGLERLGCSAIIYGPVDDEEKVLRLICESRANVLVGTPVQLHRLARWDEAYQLLPKRQIRSLLTSTDVLAKAMRANLQSIWDCEVFDHWGMTETGLGGGVECAAHDGFHLRAADLLVEIIDPETGMRLPDGEAGEVVITTLTRQAMPLIRYRTGDLSRLIPGECSCGSFSPRLDHINHRVGAGIRLESGVLTQNMLDEILFNQVEILDFSFSYGNNDGIDQYRLSLRVLPDIDINDIESQIRLKMDELLSLSNEPYTLNICVELTNSPSTQTLQKRKIKRITT